ncbi:MAG: hypothetical protein FWH41_06205, partial [Treponema sp.]|nr:hypothetical protein [Treponema sp.]
RCGARASTDPSLADRLLPGQRLASLSPSLQPCRFLRHGVLPNTNPGAAPSKAPFHTTPFIAFAGGCAF